MTGAWFLAVLRLTGLLAGVGLATSRIGLVAHELVGHGAVAVVCGGRILEVALFWFAGGWIRYRLDEPTLAAQLAITCGGIALESIVGLALWLVLRERTSLGARVVRGVGAALVIHAMWYLATGTWHGYGDGVLLHRVLGDWRAPVAIAAGLATCAMAFLGARAVLGALASTVPGGAGARIGAIALACVLAGGLQLGLAVGETRLRGDATYGAIMTRERSRVIARELTAWEREQLRQRGAIDAAERARRERELAAANRELPFAQVLAVLAALAIAGGAWRSRGATEHAIPGRVVAVACAAAAGAIALVIALGAALA